MYVFVCVCYIMALLSWRIIKNQSINKCVSNPDNWRKHMPIGVQNFGLMSGRLACQIYMGARNRTYPTTILLLALYFV